MHCLALTNLGILQAHQVGNRYRTLLAGKVRRRLEQSWDWNYQPNATDLRTEALKEMKLDGPDVTIGGKIHNGLAWYRSYLQLLAVPSSCWRNGSSRSLRQGY